VEIMFLVDTNVFLEILLGQDKKEGCKKFLDNNIGNINMTDFSLHSVGVILFRYGKEDIFRKFVEDVIPNTKLLSLPMELYREVVSIRKSLNLDFDDAYQYNVARYYELKVVTMDRDFERIKDKDVEILFL
jgi:predicted nucleic acid-binding protein